VWPEEPPFPESCPDYNRGWWSTGFEGRILFYNPDDLAAVARGEMEIWEPQPYTVMNPDAVLFHVNSGQLKNHLGATAFDRERGLLYIFEPFADGEKPIVHVWRVAS
jgi:hypothetical protein